MEKMYAFCGINCYECPTFKATQRDDHQKRIKIADLWSKEFNREITPEEINCDGCLTKGERLFSHCKICSIRKCCLEKQIDNCAYCGEYACGELSAFFDSMPTARTALEEIRKLLEGTDKAILKK